MKPVLAWLKANIALVVLGIVILAAPIAGFVVSTGMNASLRERHQGPAEKDFRDLSNASVNYVIPGLPGVPEVSESVAPNPARTAFYREQRERRAAELERIVAAGEAFGRGGSSGVIIPELLPQPPASSQRLRFDMAARVTPQAIDSVRSVYDELFDEIGAVGPAPQELISERLAADLADILARQGVQQISELPEEQAESITRTLVERRIAEYQRHARDGVMYADISVLPAVIPTARPSEAPSLVQCYQWQFDYWVIADIMRALRNANAKAADDALGILAAPIKRVLSFEMAPFPIEVAEARGSDPFSSGGRGSRGGRGGDPRGGDPRGGGFDDFGGAPSATGAGGSATLTGRSPGPSETFDVRNIRLGLVVASARIPEIYNALAQQNFFTVIDADITEIDVRDEISLGYYYGPEPVVRLDIVVETVWLRSWTSEAMPNEVKEALGIPLNQAEDDGGA